MVKSRKKLPLKVREKQLKPPIFIDSSGRSGSTLLLNILSNHPNILRIHHSNIFFSGSVYSEFGFYEKLANEKQIDKLVLAMLAEKFHHISKENIMKNSIPQEVLDEFEEIKLLSEYKDVSDKFDAFNLCANYSTIKNGKQRWVDKSHRNTFASETILQFYTEAKFIQIYRNPLAACASAKLRSKGEAPLLYDAIKWVYYVIQMEKAKAVLKDRFIMVSYEDLVNESNKTVQSICAFLNEEFNKNMLELKKTNTSFDEIKDKQKKPIYADSVSLWKKKLTFRQAFIIELVTKGLSKKLGYDNNINTSVFSVILNIPSILYEVLLCLIFVIYKNYCYIQKWLSYHLLNRA